MHWTQWLALVLAVVPSAGIVAHFVRYDRNLIGGGQIWMAFLLGAVMAVTLGWAGFELHDGFALMPVEYSPAWHGVVASVLGKAVSEQGGLFVSLLIWQATARVRQGVLSGMVRGGSLAAGFASVNNVLFVLGSNLAGVDAGLAAWPGQPWLGVARVGTGVFAQFLCGLAMGYWLAVGERSEGSCLGQIQGLGLAMLIQATCFAPLLYWAAPGAGMERWLGVAVPILIVETGLRRAGRLVATVRAREQGNGGRGKGAGEIFGDRGTAPGDASQEDAAALEDGSLVVPGWMDEGSSVVLSPSLWGRAKPLLAPRVDPTEQLTHQWVAFGAAVGLALVGTGFALSVLPFALACLIGEVGGGDMVGWLGSIVLPFLVLSRALMRSYRYLGPGSAGLPI